MEIYLIRHTATATVKGLCYGQTNVPLAESFADDVAKLRQKLPELEATAQVYSSPLTRCVQLAERLSENVTLDERLLEVNFGDWENQQFDALDEQQLRHWTENFVDHAPPNGEHFTALCDRAHSFWLDLIATDASQVFIVTHAGIIRALLAKLLELPPANAFKFRVDPGSVHKLQHSNDYTYIHYLNLCFNPHPTSSIE